MGLDRNMDLFYTRQIILNAFVLLISILLILHALHRKNRTQEISIFLRMCIVNVLLCFSHLYMCCFLKFGKILDTPLGGAVSYVCTLMAGLSNLIFVVLWLLFVEYTLHQSMDIIHRRYPAAMIPFYVGVLISVLNAFYLVLMQIDFVWGYFAGMIGKMALLIWGGYILASYVVLFREKKRKSVTQYIVLTPTVICIVTGLVLYSLTSYRVDSLGYAIGLIFADYFMLRRLGYIDPEMGFFNEKYLDVLRREARKKKIYEATVVRFKTRDNRKKLAEILKYWEPEYSRIVVKNDGEFLVISEVLKRSIAERFIFMIREHCQKEGIEVESSYETVKNT